MSGAASSVSLGVAVVESEVCQQLVGTPIVPTIKYYDGFGGGLIAGMPTASATPTATEPASNGIRFPVVNFNNRANNYSARLQGYITPAVSGAYTFHLSSDDQGQFSLGAADAALTAVAPIAATPGYSGAPGTAGVASAVVNLVAGSHYPFEAIMSEGGGGDYLFVEWSGPVGARQGIPTALLSATIFPSTTRKLLRLASVDISGVTTYTYTLPDGTPVVPTAVSPIIECPCCPSTGGSTTTAATPAVHVLQTGNNTAVPAGLRSATIKKVGLAGTVAVGAYVLTANGESITLGSNDFDSANRTWSLPAIAPAAAGGGAWQWIGV